MSTPPTLQASAEALWQAVAPEWPDFSVEVLPSIDSTNTELMRRARAGRCERVLLVAEQQTAGRGRVGRPWRSAPGASLTFSLGLPLAPSDWSGLSLAVGVSVAESLQPAVPAPGAGERIALKWPNDLWLGGVQGDRKLGGILVETASFVGQAASPPGTLGERYVVIGVGLNVLPPEGDGLSIPGGSLQSVEPGLDAPTALLRVVPPLVAMLQSFALYGFAPLQPRFALRDALAQRAVRLSDGTEGVAQGVSDEGALLVHTAQGMQAITSAEISVRPQT